MDYEGYALSYALRGVPASCLYNFGGLRVVFKSYGLIWPWWRRIIFILVVQGVV